MRVHTLETQATIALPPARVFAFFADVRWALPFGPVGELARGLVRWELDALFRYREQATRECLEGRPPSESLQRASSAPPRAISSGGH